MQMVMRKLQWNIVLNGKRQRVEERETAAREGQKIALKRKKMPQTGTDQEGNEETEGQAGRGRGRPRLGKQRTISRIAEE